MPYIRSANPSQFDPLQSPGQARYVHGADTRRGYIPIAFQITSPYDPLKALMPHALIAHVNPSNFAESFNQKVERIQTRGGYVEQHWGHELGEITAESSTGSFMNLYTGLSSVLRQRTIAWDRFQDMYDLFRNNGSLYDPFGAIVLQGSVLLMYDRGTYVGTFRSFSFEETDESPFAFRFDWTFKVENTLYQIPDNASPIQLRAPAFQSQNQTNADLAGLPPGQTQAERSAALQGDPNAVLAAQAADFRQQLQQAYQAARTKVGGIVGPLFGSSFGPSNAALPSDEDKIKVSDKSSIR